MTIIKSSAYLLDYPLQAIDEDLALKLLQTPIKPERYKRTALQLFDCHCHCLGERLSLASLDATKLRWLVESFYGHLRSGELIGLAAEPIRMRSLVLGQMISSLIDKVSGLESVMWSSGAQSGYNQTWNQSKHKIDPETASFWGCWPVKAKKGKTAYLKLVDMYDSHGPQFTSEFHEAIRRDCLKICKASSGMINKLAAFISKEAFRFPPQAFKSHEMMEEFFKEFFWHYQTTEWERNEDQSSNIRSWRALRVIIIRALLKPQIWSADESAIVLPPIKSKPGAEQNIKINKHGIQIKDKLLTEVPLHVSDIQAIDLLYGEIKSDLRTVEKYGISEALKIRRAQQRRLREAKTGGILRIHYRGSRHYNSFEKTGIQGICHTFENEGFCTTDDARSRYTQRLPALAEFLGLPTTFSLFPFQCLLTLYHPEITASFLDDLVIWDGETRVSFIKTDKGYELTGFKDRRGSKHSEQKILLSPRAAALVRIVEEITNPLRVFLKKQGDPQWQKLFLTSGSSFNYPQVADSNGLNSSAVKKYKGTRDLFIEKLSPFTHKRGEDLIDFIKKLCISRVRAQSAVADYIQNHSLTRLAKKLGHASFSQDLLDSYLPTAIYDFFATRYVRIFQKGIICEAMRESKYFLQATKFETIDQLHSFLSRYTLKEVPENLRTLEENKIAQGEVVEVGVSVSTESMTALLSIREAIRQSPNPTRVRGLAKYWASVCDAVENYIRKCRDTDLHSHLNAALKSCDPSVFRSMIHAAP
ncbi:hypothetical protein [Pseudomonas putida]|uniref:hypothetical protein n=1 Tax=Pseudomonas putida TaxID=303 RepID=UPI001F526820|nr:hypothetical protein [Pseudomonas putida]